jgi:hypothetical protein
MCITSAPPKMVCLNALSMMRRIGCASSMVCMQNMQNTPHGRLLKPQSQSVVPNSSMMTMTTTTTMTMTWSTVSTSSFPAFSLSLYSIDNPHTPLVTATSSLSQSVGPHNFGGHERGAAVFCTKSSGTSSLSSRSAETHLTTDLPVYPAFQPLLLLLDNTIRHLSLIVE